MNSLLRSREGFSACPFLFGPSSIGPPLYEGSLRVAQSRGSSPYHLTCACNVLECRDVIERLEGRSGVQLSSERSAAEAGSRPRLQHRTSINYKLMADSALLYKLTACDIFKGGLVVKWC